MGTKTETSSTLKLPLFSVNSPDDLGMLTPLHTSASIPFSWEEKPGKPRPCTDLIPHPNTNIFNEPKLCLEPPPRLYNYYMESTNKTTSPTTVLDGPYITSKPKFSSFRLLRDRRRRQGSFDSSASSETGQLSAFVLGKKKSESKSWWRRPIVKSKPGDTDECSFGFPSSTDSTDCVSLNNECTIKMATLKRSGSFSGHSQAKTHIWATIYEGFKQVIPWKSKKSKKEALLG
ncbi:uncharacterized protein At4g00950-like [Lycium ferocissimum]|uniref:uncharacterized protein At4g00950-like n=1 Tax=Lycium ferocissimum TaxID=112874 RepID=UPI002814E20C|nr:uncharacterized protein At4g00950-like [Lycium ferocissimum]